MPRVLLIRPNDFIADAMAALVARTGLEALRLGSPAELDSTPLAGVVGAVVSTAVTSVMPASFREVVVALRRRAGSLPLVATTLLRDPSKAAALIVTELQGVVFDIAPIRLDAQTLEHPALGTARGVLILRKDEVDAASPLTVRALQRHFGAAR